VLLSSRINRSSRTSWQKADALTIANVIRKTAYVHRRVEKMHWWHRITLFWSMIKCGRTYSQSNDSSFEHFKW